MAMNVPTLNSTLNDMQERECSWYEECSYEYDARETQGVFGGGFCVKTFIIVDGFGLGYNIRFEKRGRRYHMVSHIKGRVCEQWTMDYDRAMALYEKLVREACVAITGREESATAIWPVSNKSAA